MHLDNLIKKAMSVLFQKQLTAINYVAIDVSKKSPFYHKNFRLESVLKSSLTNRRSSRKYDQLWQDLRHALHNLVVINEKENCFIDIKDLTGMTSSKSQTDNWESLFEFGRSYRCENIPNETMEDIERNLAYSFPKNERLPVFNYCLWDNSLYWFNHNGSHHAAAAHVQAVKSNYISRIKCCVRVLKLNSKEVDNVVTMFHCFIVKTDMFDYSLQSLLVKMKIPFQQCTLSIASELLYLVFIPKNSLFARPALDLVTKNQPFDSLVNFNTLLIKNFKNQERILNGHLKYSNP